MLSVESIGLLRSRMKCVSDWVGNCWFWRLVILRVEFELVKQFVDKSWIKFISISNEKLKLAWIYTAFQTVSVTAFFNSSPSTSTAFTNALSLMALLLKMFVDKQLSNCCLLPSLPTPLRFATFDMYMNICYGTFQTAASPSTATFFNFANVNAFYPLTPIYMHRGSDQARLATLTL